LHHHHDVGRFPRPNHTAGSQLNLKTTDDDNGTATPLQTHQIVDGNGGGSTTAGQQSGLGSSGQLACGSFVGQLDGVVMQWPAFSGAQRKSNFAAEIALLLCSVVAEPSRALLSLSAAEQQNPAIRSGGARRHPAGLSTREASSSACERAAPQWSSSSLSLLLPPPLLLLLLAACRGGRYSAPARPDEFICISRESSTFADRNGEPEMIFTHEHEFVLVVFR
jgi:hypothetical protein